MVLNCVRFVSLGTLDEAVTGVVDSVVDGAVDGAADCAGDGAVSRVHSLQAGGRGVARVGLQPARHRWLPAGLYGAQPGRGDGGHPRGAAAGLRGPPRHPVLRILSARGPSQ